MKVDVSFTSSYIRDILSQDLRYVRIDISHRF